MTDKKGREINSLDGFTTIIDVCVSHLEFLFQQMFNKIVGENIHQGTAVSDVSGCSLLIATSINIDHV